MSIEKFDLLLEMEQIKKKAGYDELGMILVHNGIVRATPRKGDGRVRAMRLSCDRERLEKLVEKARNREGIVDVVVWINEGVLNVGDDIMYFIVAGDRRSNIMPLFEELIEKIKTEIVVESEILE